MSGLLVVLIVFLALSVIVNVVCLIDRARYKEWVKMLQFYLDHFAPQYTVKEKPKLKFKAPDFGPDFEYEPGDFVSGYGNGNYNGFGV